LLSAAEIKQLPPDQGIEVAIVGRSNAGKSSVLNRITQSKNLARVSKTPGRTQLINVFVLDENKRIVDLPGYGFAKAPLAAKQKWERAINEYICTRESLTGLVMIMDIRHPLRELDQLLLDFCEHDELPVHIVLNKADKLSKGAAGSTLQAVKKSVESYTPTPSVQLFSALKGIGIEELHKQLDRWYFSKAASSEML